jgi:hypothetical protein
MLKNLIVLILYCINIMDEQTEPTVVLNMRKKKYKKKRKLILIDEDEDNYGEIENIEQSSTTILPSKKILTEDLGKMFEMAICMLYEIDYDGKYNYSLDEANLIKNKLVNLKNVFPYKIKHIAKNGSRYDFVSLDDANVYLSAKTTKKNGKVCPQVIGQPSKKKFCQYFNLDVSYDNEQIKNYIQNNVENLLAIYSNHTFDCPIVYYNKHSNKLLFIKLKNPIVWTDQIISFSHIIKNKKWNESSTISINNITLGEFQIHNKRDGIKFRWSFEKLLQLFSVNFEIINLAL